MFLAKEFTVEEIKRRYEKIKQEIQHGHPKFYKLLTQEAELHSIKNKGYAQGGDPLGNFKRVSAIMKLYPNMDWSNPEGVALVYKLKQMDCAFWQLSQGYEDELEGFGKRLQDDSVYDKLATILHEEENEDNSKVA